MRVHTGAPFVPRLDKQMAQSETALLASRTESDEEEDEDEDEDKDEDEEDDAAKLSMNICSA